MKKHTGTEKSENQHNPGNPSIHSASCISPLSEALGAISLPLWLEIVAIDITLSPVDNEGALSGLRVVGGITKNASCNEPGD